MIAWDSLGQAIRDATFWLEAGIEIRELEVATFRWMILKANELCPTGIQYKTYYLNLYHCWRNKEDHGRQLFHGLVDDCRRLFRDPYRDKLFFTERSGKHCSPLPS